MAQATSVNITSVQGAREDLSNQLRRVNPEETPMYSLLPQSAAPKAVETSWMVDDLPAPDFANPLADGTDLTFDGSYTNEIANRVRLSNKIQQVQRSASVSPIAEQVEVAGPQTSLLAASKSRVLTSLKTDLEALIGSNNVQADGTSSVGSKMSGLFHITNPTATNGFFDTTAKQAFRSVAGSRHSTGTLTEAAFRNVVQSIFEAGGTTQSYRLFAGPELMNVLTGFSRALNVVGGAQSKFDANIQGTKITLSVVELVSDYGTIIVHPDLFLNRTSGAAPTALSKKSGVLIPTDDNVSLKVLQPITVQDLPESGGGERFLTRTIMTLCVLNPRALGSITTVS
jgi:hypothetical protein